MSFWQAYYIIIYMIFLTRLNDSQIVINADLIKSLESQPDTILTLINGDKIIIKEEISTVIDRVKMFKKSIMGVI